MDESLRVAQIFEVADELLAELGDTVFDEHPPEFYDDEYDDDELGGPTEVDPAPNHDHELDTFLETLHTEAAPWPPPAVALQTWPLPLPPPAAPPRRSWFRSMIETIRGWFVKRPAPPVIAPLESSNAWSYTMADRRVAQARQQRAQR